MISMVVAASCLLGTGACAPIGYGGGAVMAVSGAVVVAHGVSACDENVFECVLVGLPEARAGGALVLTGLATIAVTALAQAVYSEMHQPAAAPAAAPPAPPAWDPDAAPASASASGSAPGVWPAPPISRSPSAPLGSPLAPTQALSLRTGAGSGAGSLMAFH
jgi:hypothetical protein